MSAVCTHGCTYVSAHVCTHAATHAYMHVCTYICCHRRTHSGVSPSVERVYTHVHAHVCTRARTHAYTHACTHAHTLFFQRRIICIHISHDVYCMSTCLSACVHTHVTGAHRLQQERSRRHGSSIGMSRTCAADMCAYIKKFVPACVQTCVQTCLQAYVQTCVQFLAWAYAQTQVCAWTYG